MAQQARDERHLMRQRGAGVRNVTNPEFDLDFGAGSREERRLMRQRGAGNREVNNIDFGFAFATPVQQSSRFSRTRSKTPATSSRTPLERNVEDIPIPLSSARSTRSQHLPATVTQRSITRSTGEPQRKRRRLSEVSNITRATSLDLPAVSDINEPEIPNSEQLQDASRVLRTISGQRSRDVHYTVPSSPLFFPSPSHDEIEADKENTFTPSEGVKVTAKKKKRKLIGQQSLFKKKRPSGSSTVSLPTPPVIDENQQSDEPRVHHSDLLSVNDDSASLNIAPKGITSISSKSTQPLNIVAPIISKLSKLSKHRKKRKSIVGNRRKRKSTETISVTQPDVIPDVETQHDEEPGSAPMSERGFEIDLDQGPSTTRKTSRRRLPSSPYNEAPQADIHDEGADETYLPDENTPEPTPAPKRVKGNRKAKQGSNNIAKSTRVNEKNGGFPILTHRMTNTYKLPTIFEEAEQGVPCGAEDTVDELSIPLPAIMTRSAPNAVDVLAQACRETVDGYIRKLKDGPTELSRAERTRQLTALQTFRSNLDIQLFDLSQSLDQRLHMEARLRKQRREKADLQAQWLEVRKQRDRLELRMDAVRRQHWEAEVLSRKVWNISQSAHRLETAVSRDESDMNQGSGADLLEFSLDQLKQDVSLKDGGGILTVLSQFNTQLERTARTLN